MFKLSRIVLSVFLFSVTISSETLAETLKVGIPIQDSEPFVIKQEERIEGMIVDVWDEIAEEQDIEYEWVHQDNYANALDAVAQGDIDIFVGPISITPTRLEKVEFTLPVDEFEIVILSQAQAPSLWSRIRPFVGITAISSLVLLIVSVFIVGNLIWWAERKVNSGHFPKEYLPGIRNGMWFAMVTMTTVGYGDFAPITNLGRFVAAIWMLITLLALSSITAGLASAMTISLANQSRPRFSSVEDIRQAKIATVSGWASSRWANYYNADITEAPTLEEAVSLVAENKVDGFIADRVTLSYYLEQNPELDLSIANFTIANELYGFALSKDSEVTHDLNSVIMQMRQNTEIQELKEKWL